MASLPNQLLLKLVQACLNAQIDPKALLASLPAEIEAAVPVANTHQKQLYYTFCHLNKMRWPSGSRHPMNTALETGAFLARAYGLEDAFLVAEEHFAEPATVDTSKEHVFSALFTRRMKETYLDFGCRVTPSLDDPPGPFMVEHPDRRTSVVAVFYDAGEKGPRLESVIAGVQQWLQLARSSGEDADGYIVLAPAARKSEREEVLSAQLHPIDYAERRSIGFDTIKTIVRCLLGEEPQPAEVGFSILQGGEACPAEDALAAFLRDARMHVWLLLQPRDADDYAFRRELFQVAARSFLRHGLPAPLPLGAGWHARRVTECACAVFTHHGIPVSPIVMERVLLEGVICPILVHDVEDPSPSVLSRSLATRLLDGMSEHSKRLVVFSPDQGAIARQVGSALHDAGYEARVIRALVNEV